jgi:DNA repair protein RecO (recombination protein O)
LAGVAPQVQACCITQHSIIPDFSNPDWRVGFSVEAGGTVSLTEHKSTIQTPPRPLITKGGIITQTTSSHQTETETMPPPRLNIKLDATELTVLQQLAGAELPNQSPDKSLFDVDAVWVKVERILRDYSQYHFGRSIRSAVLIDALSGPDF